MKKGLRRAGIVGLSTVVAGSMMTGLAVTASALPPAYTALSAPNVTQGGANQAAGSLTLDFTNNPTNTSQTFTIAGNDCTSGANIAQAVKFAALPTATLTGPFATGGGTAGTAAKPVFTTTLGSSGGPTGACATAGVKDVVTFAIALPAGAPTNDWFELTLSNVKYNVGAATPVGNISVTSAGSLPGGTVINAKIPAIQFSNTAKVAALPTATGVSLGTQTFVEGSAGTGFPAAGSGNTLVTLTLSDGLFTAGVTPTITLPTGYSLVPATPVPPTTAALTYSFTVHAVTPAVKATVTIAGLTMTAPATVEEVTVQGMLGASAIATPPVAVNVVNYNARTGGATRYETAAALFNSKFGTFGANNGFAVLARGDLFPDALSANYLAGKLHTGTLLTTSSTLSSAARQSIISSEVTTVYIVGGTGAVSQAVQNQVEALHVSNAPFAPFISVVRLGGADRYATNLLVNENAFTPENTVLLASGANFPDALAFGPIAAGVGDTTGSKPAMPLILTAGTTLGSHEMAQLSDFSPANVVIGGGTGVVSAAIETQLKASGYTVLRLAGADRTQTAEAIANWATVGVGTTPGTLPAITAPRGSLSDTTYIATGNLFPDSLAAGPVAGANKRVILLTYSGLGAGIPSYLGTKTLSAVAPASGLKVDTLHALGLTGAVSPADMKAAAATIQTP